MTKETTRGGLVSRALSCGCAVALAASLAPAAGVAWAATTTAANAGDPLPAVDGTATVTVNVGTFDSSGANYTPFTQVEVKTGTEAMQKLYQDQAVLFYSSGWNVAATSRFLSLTDILAAADLDQYWDSNAKLWYDGATYTVGSSTAVAAGTAKAYSSYQDRYFFPNTEVGTDTSKVSSPATTPVETGIAYDVYATAINEAVSSASSTSSKSSTAGGTADLMYKAFDASTIPTALAANSPTAMNGLTVSDYKAQWNCADTDVLSAAPVTSINIAVPEAMNVSRIYGTDWADTMTDAVTATFGDTAQTDIVLTTAETFQDALAASGLAGALECPIVMTDGDELTPQTAKLLEKYADVAAATGAFNNSLNIYVIGGEVAIKPAVIDAIKQLPTFYGKQASADGTTVKGLAITRIAGDEAWDTSLEIRKAMKGEKYIGTAATSTGINDVVIACSGGYEDAMSIAPYAYATGTPVILTNNANVLSDSELYALNGVGVTGALNGSSSVNIIGGPAVVSSQVEAQLAGIEKVNRTYGQSAYDTSNRVATYLYNDNARFATAAQAFSGAAVTNCCFATGENYLDALASSQYCGTASKNPGGASKASVLLLVSNSDDTTIDGFLTSATTMKTAKIFGGEGVLGKAVQMDINQVLISDAE